MYRNGITVCSILTKTEGTRFCVRTSVRLSDLSRCVLC